MKFTYLLFLFFYLSAISFAQSSTLKAGDTAPDFTLKDAYDNSYTLSDFRNESPVVVYFYPKANTAGCTKEACGIRDNMTKLEKNNIKVLGISTDSQKEIKRFIDDYGLNFPLLSDYEKNVTKKYGVLSDNGVAKRVTFIIDKKGKIAKVFKVTDISSHADEVFEEANRLN